MFENRPCEPNLNQIYRTQFPCLFYQFSPLFFVFLIPFSPIPQVYQNIIYNIHRTKRVAKKKEREKKGKKSVTSIYRIRNHGVPIRSQYSCLREIRQQIFKWSVHGVPGKSSRSTELYFFFTAFSRIDTPNALLSNPPKHSNTTNLGQRPVPLISWTIANKYKLL